MSVLLSSPPPPLACPPPPRRRASRAGRASRVGVWKAQAAGAAWAAAETEAPTKGAAFVCPQRLNTTPHARETRQLFYEDCARAAVQAASLGNTRVNLRSEIPELNTEGDVYRVGTMLELARHVATTLIRARGDDDAMSVKICVQGSLGEGIFTGLPLSLSGVRRLLEMLDFEDDVADRVRVGAVSADDVEPDVAAYIVLSPQNIVNGCVVPLLEEMVDAAEALGQTVFVFNPNLADVPSSGGKMQVGGRKERLQFAKTFEEAYHFRLLYQKPYFYPVYGCLRRTPGEPWCVYKRTGGRRLDEPEDYVLVGEFPTEPSPKLITGALMRPQKTEATTRRW